jgi:hypothetical protein
LTENARVVGEHLQNGLRELIEKIRPNRRCARFRLMVGVEFVESKATMKAAPELRDKIEMACFERGLIILGLRRKHNPLVATADFDEKKTSMSRWKFSMRQSARVFSKNFCCMSFKCREMSVKALAALQRLI